MYSIRPAGNLALFLGKVFTFFHKRFHIRYVGINVGERVGCKSKNAS